MQQYPFQSPLVECTGNTEHGYCVFTFTRHHSAIDRSVALIPRGHLVSIFTWREEGRNINQNYKYPHKTPLLLDHFRFKVMSDSTKIQEFKTPIKFARIV